MVVLIFLGVLVLGGWLIMNSTINYDYKYENEDMDFENILEETPLMIQDEISSEYLHFAKKNITFAMTGLDAPVKRKRMYDALEEIEEEVGEFDFIEIDEYENADIKISFPKSNNLDVIGEARPIIDDYGDIIGGEITIIKISDDCDYYGAELHELLHVFGFEHRDDGIMYPYNDKCYNLKDSSFDYIEHLQFIYSSGVRGIEHSEIPMFELKYGSCSKGWHEAINSDKFCCPEPDMRIDEDGFCV